MNFSVEKSISILERTPVVLIALLENISEDWTSCNEGEDTWSTYDIIGHYIHGEITDWIPRMEIILSDNPDKSFQPFDRFAQLQISKGKSIQKLLEEFSLLRKKNIEILRSADLTKSDFAKKGIHPAFNEVSLSQLLSTWVVHDLNHIGQICRVMAKHYQEDVGPWVQYLRILKS